MLLHRGSFALIACCALSNLTLSACGITPPLTYAEVQATATVTGCWPATYPTPVPLRSTPTPYASPTPTTLVSPTTQLVLNGNVLTPTLTPTARPTLPTLPLCPPADGSVPTPFPTPIPAPKPYPTMRPSVDAARSAQQTTFALPGKAYAIDLAVHPTENWPVVGVMHRQSLLVDPIQIFVRVYNPHTRRWGVAQQVDVGTASAGTDKNGSVAVTISGDRTVHAVWGASDDDGGVWTSQSGDYGATWSHPQRIASGCTVVNDAGATLDGQIVVLAMCGRLPTHPTLIVRDAQGHWGSPEQLRIAGWFGALVVTGDGDAAQATALVTGHGDGMPTNEGALIQRRLGDNGPWSIRTLSLDGPGSYFWQLRGLAVSHSDGSTGIGFTLKGQYSPSVYALWSSDNGANWGELEPVVGGQQNMPRAADDNDVAFPVPGYIPEADQLITLWVCCGDASEVEPATHYASTRARVGGQWQPSSPDGATPLILGSRSTGDTASGQAAGAGDLWLAWIERNKEIVVRSIGTRELLQERPQ